MNVFDTEARTRQPGSYSGVVKIVSGGQTGVDRAALDAAMSLGIDCGGWCPHGRLAEDGPLDDRYPVTETPSAVHAQRTEWNVRDSDATLILNSGPLAGGTALTMELARRLGKPCLILDLDEDPAVEAVVDWLAGHGVAVLNLAGPRESGRPGIQQDSYRFLRRLLAVSLP